MVKFSKADLKLMREKGISESVIEKQLHQFQNGFPPLSIIKPATAKDGIRQISESKLKELICRYERLGGKMSKTKFIPASGAATRMFKELFELLNNYTGSEGDYLKIMADRKFGSVFYLCENLPNVAFYNDLEAILLKNNITYEQISHRGDLKLLLELILTEKGINYGNLPKGLLKFHRSNTGERTPVEEHFIEGAQYASTGKKVHLHFTVSDEHLALFKAHIASIKPKYEKAFGVKYKVDFSVQLPSTDTIAVDAQNEPLRNAEGALLFRPGGHGALLQNLGSLNDDLIFIKNIDNVVQDRLKQPTIDYKKALAGWLLGIREKSERYYNMLDKKTPEDIIMEIESFLKKQLTIIIPANYYEFTKLQKVAYLKGKLNRPIRVCGMVRNQGEPGGGPYWVKSADGSLELQIVESSQFNAENKHLMLQSTHFNPVDIICCIKDFKGKKFKLEKFVDESTGFISTKSAGGHELKALELPGLWNGAMAGWTTVFAEVPPETFNPVKTVSDLLRGEHLYEKDLLKMHTNKVID